MASDCRFRVWDLGVLEVLKPLVLIADSWLPYHLIPGSQSRIWKTESAKLQRRIKARFLKPKLESDAQRKYKSLKRVAPPRNSG